MRIKFIVPSPLDEQGIANQAAQIPQEILDPNTEVTCVSVRNSGTLPDSPYDLLLFEMYVTEAGLRAEEEGYDAVVIDTVSDSGLYALRARLSIPVIGPGLVACCVATMLGRKFSIITMLDEWKWFYQKNLDAYHLREQCASIRALGMSVDLENLFTGREDLVFPRIVEVGTRCIDEDGADVILLGSTTMHQAGEHLSAHVSAPVINPGPIAVKLTESIVLLGLTHSKLAFRTPGAIQDEKFFSLIGARDEP